MTTVVGSARTVSIVAPASTQLAIAAGNLNSGESASFPHNPYSTTFDIQWCLNWEWDSDRLRAQYSGKPASSQSHDWSHNVYDVASDSWTRDSAFYTGTNPSGHVWGGHCIDPETGDYYLHLYKLDVVWRRTYSTGLWDFITSSGGSGTGGIEGTSVTGPSNGMAWHPNLFGIGDGGFIIGTRYKIRAWRKSTDSWSDPTINGAYNTGDRSSGASLYLPGADVAVIGSGAGVNTLCVIGAGSGGSTATVNLYDDGTTRRVFGPGAGNTSSSKIIVDPRNTSRIMKLYSGDSTAVYISDDYGQSWTADGSHPFNALAGFSANSWIPMGIPDYGIVWALSDASSIIWKP